MVSKCTLALCALLILAASAADAATLFTPPLPKGAAYRCEAVNVATRPRDVVLSIFASNSGSIATVSCMALQPGHVCTLNGDQFSSYCRIDVSGSRTAIRGAMTALVGDAVAGALAAQ